MQAEGVLVSCSIGGLDIVVSQSTLFSSSGIKFANKWILTHGSLIWPLKNARKIFESPPNMKKTKIDRLYAALPDVFVTMERRSENELESNSNDKQFKNGDNAITAVTKANPADGRINNVSKGRIKFIWKCPLLAETVDTMLSSWTVGQSPGTIDMQNESGNEYLSVFVLIYIGDCDNKHTMPIITPITILYQSVLKRSLLRGEQIHLDSTPFGNEVFINSRTAGVVCNTVGKQNCIVLCDASSALCSEGGPGFLEYNGTLFGMIICSLSWCRGEWVGLTLMASLEPILKIFIFNEVTATSQDSSLTKSYLPFESVINEIDSIVVLVRCGESWGSGVSLGNGYFISCSHVVKYHKKYGISLFSCGKTAKAIVLFRTHDDKAYDLALLYSNQTAFKSSKPVIFAEAPPFKGETIVAAGFPYFSEKNVHNLRPTITKGQINRAVPQMIQTSCCVQSGCSGGAILRLYREPNSPHINCHLLGIIVCNTKNDEDNTAFPYINMAVPVKVFQKTVEDYMRKPSTSILKTLDEDQQYVQLLWNLQQSSDSKL